MNKPANNVMSLNEFKALWLSRTWKKGEGIQLYIDNPFCKTSCKFCIYNSTPSSTKTSFYKKYYNEYLPYLINEFSDVINTCPVKAIYFGGGTASLMTVDIMTNLFDLIPGFTDIPVKMFECNPSSLNSDKLDVLIQKKFTYVSLGVQFFDNDLLKREKRETNDPKKIQTLVKYLQDCGVKVNCDLLTFVKTGTIADLNGLTEDLSVLMNVVDPQIISIYPMYQSISTTFSIENEQRYSKDDRDKNYLMISELRKVLIKFCIESRKYVPPYADALSLDKNKILENSKTDYSLTRLPVNELAFLSEYNCSGFPHHLERQNVLGLGGYKRRTPYSYFGRSSFYNLLNVGWKPYFIEV